MFKAFPLGVIVALGIAFWMLAQSGCSAAPPPRHAPLTDGYGHPRSLVTDPAPMLALRSTPAERAAAGTPWYASRHDRPVAVAAGYASPRFERTVTRTRDRQDIHTGRVRDNIDVDTYSITVRESVSN
ncbi:MAG: hypothetical protein AAF823_10970 [Planctomycetota bacterium]